jgi:hypothetical protein
LLAGLSLSHPDIKKKIKSYHLVTDLSAYRPENTMGTDNNVKFAVILGFSVLCVVSTFAAYRLLHNPRKKITKSPNIKSGTVNRSKENKTPNCQNPENNNMPCNHDSTHEIHQEYRVELESKEPCQNEGSQELESGCTNSAAEPLFESTNPTLREANDRLQKYHGSKHKTVQRQDPCEPHVCINSLSTTAVRQGQQRNHQLTKGALCGRAPPSVPKAVRVLKPRSATDNDDVLRRILKARQRDRERDSQPPSYSQFRKQQNDRIKEVIDQCKAMQGEAAREQWEKRQQSKQERLKPVHAFDIDAGNVSEDNAQPVRSKVDPNKKKSKGAKTTVPSFSVKKQKGLSKKLREEKSKCQKPKSKTKTAKTKVKAKAAQEQEQTRNQAHKSNRQLPD